jgi:hypothetical protein
MPFLPAMLKKVFVQKGAGGFSGAPAGMGGAAGGSKEDAEKKG